MVNKDEIKFRAIIGIVCRCDKCGHVWMSKNNQSNMPNYCPKCKRTNWY